MQDLTAPPRNALTAAQVTALIQDSPSPTIGRGLELLDNNLNVVEDISVDLRGGSVSRASYATLHGTCSLGVSRVLDWGRAIVRPYMTITDGIVLARFNLGAYFTSTPRQNAAPSPPTHEVAGYDILDALDLPAGTTYAVDTGTGYLAAAETILIAQGYTKYSIDQTAGGAVLPAPMVWILDDNPTWMTIVNDLLGAVGYAGVWSDWDGVLRLAPYRLPQDRGPEWSYNVGKTTSMIRPARARVQDFYKAPNRWVFKRSGSATIDGPPPVEGNGIFTYINQRSGQTSVEARGRVITAPTQSVEAVDQAALVTQGTMRIEADLRLKTTLELSTFPNPMHWHFDRVNYDDGAFGAPMRCLVTRWTLPLDGTAMTHEWSVI